MFTSYHRACYRIDFLNDYTDQYWSQCPWRQPPDTGPLSSWPPPRSPSPRLPRQGCRQTPTRPPGDPSRRWLPSNLHQNGHTVAGRCQDDSPLWRALVFTHLCGVTSGNDLTAFKLTVLSDSVFKNRSRLIQTHNFVRWMYFNFIL